MARRRSRRRSGRDWRGLALAALLIAGSAVLIGGYFFLRSDAQSRPTLEAASLCPIDGAHGIVVALLDVTDELPAVARQQVETELRDIAAALPEYYLLQLRVLDPAVPGGRSAFSKCNPGDGSNLSEITANPELAYRRWLEEFDAPLDAALSGALVGQEADTSPIMATIQQIAVDLFYGDERRSVPKELIVVSDMIENAAGYSQYQGDLTYDRFRSSPVYRDLHTDLGGASVTIFYVQRPQQDGWSAGEHLEFWLEWIADNDGIFAEAIRLQGLR